MTLDESLAALLEAKLAPLRHHMVRLLEEIAELRCALPSTLVPLDEAANRLGVSLSTVRRMAKSGALPVRRLGGRTLRVDLRDLAAPRDAEVVRLALHSRARR
jgi:excisionase family DNA binding protein